MVILNVGIVTTFVLGTCELLDKFGVLDGAAAVVVKGLPNRLQLTVAEPDDLPEGLQRSVGTVLSGSGWHRALAVGLGFGRSTPSVPHNGST